jgi:hypothetical protein
MTAIVLEHSTTTPSFMRTSVYARSEGLPSERVNPKEYAPFSQTSSKYMVGTFQICVRPSCRSMWSLEL